VVRAAGARPPPPPPPPPPPKPPIPNPQQKDIIYNLIILFDFLF